MHRFFLGNTLGNTSEGASSGDAGLTGAQPGMSLTLPVPLSHQIRDVLHIATDEQLILFDNSGDELLCTVTRSQRNSVEVLFVERRTGKPEPHIQIILCQGLLKSARFELILEKGTELGVSTFIPTVCQRSTAGLAEAGPKKVERWQRIIQEAAEQCGRTHIPELRPIQTLRQVLQALPEDALRLMPWEEEHALSLYETLHSRAIQQMAAEQKALTVIAIIGPEGGLTAEEAELARQHGVQVVTLGSRILRAETAAIHTVASLIYELER